MTTLTIQSKKFRPTIGRFVMALTLASVIGGMAITPALADNNDRRGHRDNGRHNGERHGDRDRREYQQPVYAPAPIYYTPQQSPGISFFFPLDFRR